jgi:hypothetical protein
MAYYVFVGELGDLSLRLRKRLLASDEPLLRDVGLEADYVM